MFSNDPRTTRFIREYKLKLKTASISPIKRAALREFIEGLVHDWPLPSVLPNEGAAPTYLPTFIAMPTMTTATKGAKPPHIAVIDGKLFCNTAYIDLSCRPLMLRLVAAFCATDGQKLSREDILKCVYLIGAPSDYSARYLDAKYRNAVRLMSRARKIAELHLSSGDRDKIEWFIYDQRQQLWCLSRTQQKTNEICRSFSEVSYYSRKR
jgi:hypothetical protein